MLCNVVVLLLYEFKVVLGLEDFKIDSILYIYFLGFLECLVCEKNKLGKF